MNSEVIEKTETPKPKVINHKFTDKAYSKALKLQEGFKKRTGARLNLMDVINKSLEKTTSL